jgi:hypothetical protein
MGPVTAAWANAHLAEAKISGQATAGSPDELGEIRTVGTCDWSGPTPGAEILPLYAPDGDLNGFHGISAGRPDSMQALAG